MIITNQNNVLDTQLKAIIDYSTIALLNKSEFEIIIEGLDVYKNFPGCYSATLFFLDQNNYEFYYKTSTDLNNESELTNIYDRLIDEGHIAQVLGNLEIVEWENSQSNNAQKHFLVTPLVTTSGVIALVLLAFTLPPDNRETLFALIRHHSDNYALRIQNIKLYSEAENYKSEIEKKIALSTKDIVQSTRELKLILNSVQIGIIIVDKDKDTILDANTKAAEIIGTTKEYLIGTKNSEHFFSNDKKITQRVLRVNQEGLIKKANGTLVPILKTTDTVRMDEHDSYIVSFVDITERKKTEEALQKAHFELERRVEERTIELSKANQALKREIYDREKAEEDILKLYWAVHQSPVSIIITNLDGIIEYVNPQFSEMTGYKFEEMVGQNPRVLRSGEMSTECYAALWEKITGGGEWRGEFRNKKKNGELFWVAASVSSIRNNEGETTHFLCIEEDITDSKKAYQDLLEAKERAEESDKLKSQILANMNHEFRTPLIGILGFSQVLLSDELTPEQTDMINSIYLSGKRLLNTSDGILTLSQLESHQKALNFEKINLADHLHKPVEKYLPAAEEKDLKLTIEIKNDEILIEADVELLYESIGYLVDNAIKYTNAGNITITADKAVNNKAYIKIKDTGIGIELKQHKSIFEAFRQASEGYARSYEGCGLGLTIAKKYIELMKGEITLESEFSVGSTFTIWLPSYNQKVIS